MLPSPALNFTLVECPRDGWQGIPNFIPTETKIQYLQLLIDAGFPVIDMGSFVSAKAVPQVSDTGEVLNGINPGNCRLLVIVANLRGAASAVGYPQVSCVGYPFSISETFQRRNANSTIDESLKRLVEINDLCDKHRKELVVYLSMGFGNPYGDPWNTELVLYWIDRLAALGVKTISLADTVGLASENDIRTVYDKLIPAYAGIEFGAHLHSRPDSWLNKVSAAFTAGCRRFDSVISGLGGCPFAQDDLVGNIATENLLQFAQARGLDLNLKPHVFDRARTFFHEFLAPYKD